MPSAIPERSAPASDHVELVRQGAGTMLSIGGTDASWYQPDRALTGSVWDALALPVTLLAPGQRRDLLVLGLGGGSAARLLRAAAPRARIVGVEPLPGVIAAARQGLALDTLDLEVVCSDAERFLGGCEARFDFVLEDCFLGGPHGLSKPTWLCGAGLDAMIARLRPGGVLVVDTVHEDLVIAAGLRARMPHVVRIELGDCTNRIFVASRRAIDARSLRAAVRASDVFAGALPNLRMRTVEGRSVRVSP